MPSVPCNRLKCAKHSSAVRLRLKFRSTNCRPFVPIRFFWIGLQSQDRFGQLCCIFRLNKLGRSGGLENASRLSLHA